MNADELRKADEIVMALRDYASDCDADEACRQCTFAWVCDKFDCNAPKIIADLIESLTAQLTASQRRADTAVEDINLLEDCGVCKHHDLDSCDLAGTECHFEWRGPQAEKGAADGN